MAVDLITERRRFVAGTTGWTASDLDDPRIERIWEKGHFEIVEGVLTKMAAAYYDPNLSLSRLERQVIGHLHMNDPAGEFTHETDVIVGELRVPRPDAIYLSPSDRTAQRVANATHGRGRRSKLVYGRVLVPPTLVIESLSLGHEDHDRITKRAWYQQMGVPNYWMLNFFERSLECLSLNNGTYSRDAYGVNDERVSPSFLSGGVIELGELWRE